jgi:radical SAM superfamily enzyme YgiQ (UPF0313 family)
MRVLFIYPDICSGKFDFQPGIAYISAVLRNEGHQTSLLHVRSEISKEQILKIIQHANPDLIGFYSNSHQYSYVESYAKWIKESLDVPIICGGIHATLCPKEVISCRDIDMVCVGEGEYPMLELVDCLERGKNINKILNLWVKNGNKEVRNPVRPLIDNLDELPFPDRDLFNYKKILRRNRGFLTLLAGRGCPFDCTYCCNHALKKIYKGKGRYVRFRSVENVLDEINFTTQKYGNLVKGLNFDDDTFTIYHKWVKEFCKEYPKEFDYPFYCNVRADTVNREILLMLKKAGCEVIRLGIESGNEWLRKNILKRNITNEQIIRICKIAHKIGLKVYTFNVIGFPFETKSMIEETIKLNRLISPDYIQFSIFYPYPKTELWNLCKRKGLLTNRNKKSYFDKGTTLNLPELEEEIDKYYFKFKEMAQDSFIKSHYPDIRHTYEILKILLGTKNMLKLYDKISNDEFLNSVFRFVMDIKSIFHVKM